MDTDVVGAVGQEKPTVSETLDLYRGVGED